MKKPFSLLIILLFSFSLQAQQKSYPKIWQSLLKNSRKEALNLAKKIKPAKTDIEGLVLKEITQIENGGFSNTNNFIEELVKHKDYEYYLYALFNQSYALGDVKNNDFNKYFTQRIKFLSKQNIGIPVLKDIVNYQNYETAKTLREADYLDYTKNINAITDWQFCGTFENLNKSGINTVYPPEKSAFSKTGYNANSNGIVNWYHAPVEKGNPYTILKNHNEYGSGINYAQTFIKNDQARDIYLQLGIGQATKVWMDDVLLFEKDENRISDMGAYTIKLHLPAGNNRLLIKANNSEISYFIVKITDKNGNPIKALNISSKYSPYVKADKKTIHPEIIPNKFETYFEQKVAEHPDSYFYNYCLVETYLRNEKEKKAEKIIDKYAKKFPESSWVKLYQIRVKQLEGNNEKVNEIIKNIENNDKHYYWSLIQKMAKVQKLLKKDLPEFNKEIDEISNTVKSPIVKPTCDLIKAFRQNDNEKMKQAVKKLIEVAVDLESPETIDTYTALYYKIFKDEDYTLKQYENAYHKFFDIPITGSLSFMYNKKGDHDKAIEIYKSLLTHEYWNNTILLRLAKKLIDLQRYKEALPYIDDGLKNFPYSFIFMKKKGYLLQQLGHKKEALKWYKKSLAHNSADFELRKTINDLENVKNPLKKVLLKDPYAYIKTHRGKIKKNNYGINILYDDYNILLYNEGGHTNHNTMIYEVTSEKGIEDLKEYNMGLSGDYEIVKSEIVKPDGSIVPAERSGSQLVFNNLSIGDVILAEYEINYTSTGRFYKDLTKKFRFDTYSPSMETNFRIIAPKNKKLHYTVTGGKIDFEQKNMGKYTLYHWHDKMSKGLSPSEDYMPPLVDVARVVHVSTIDTWDNIANWYADLSRSSIKYNKTVNETFDKIFPNGYKKLSEYDRAKKIYDYMAANLTYSFVDFKQSGFIPQKPSKTIESKLGDCKDFSTLFLTMGRKAGLKVNLVLVNTSDNGKNSDVLPAINFNHCIVNVNIDGTGHYLELTDKDLPFNSQTTGLYGANGLEIPYKKGEKIKKGLISIQQTNAIPAKFESDINYTIYPDKQIIDVTLSGDGSRAAILHDLLNPKSDVKLKKDILKTFEDLDNLDLDLISYKILDNDRTHKTAKFKAQFKVLNKMQKLGKSYIFKLPLLLQSYTQGVINNETRHYPIDYIFYENTKKYISHYTIELKNGKKFNEIPEDESFTYKKHHFTAKYHKLSDTKLEATITAQTSFDNIAPQEYPAFKQYVKSVLEVFDALISFK